MLHENDIQFACVFEKVCFQSLVSHVSIVHSCDPLKIDLKDNTKNYATLVTINAHYGGEIS